MSGDATDCPYAPRHRPDCQGVCDWCQQPVPEPWYMRRRLGPAETVAEIATRHGVLIGSYLAQQIADVILGYADAVMQVRQAVPREAWVDERYRGHLRQRMRAQLVDYVAKQGRIPAALPSEAIRYLALPALLPGQDHRQSEVPAEMVARGAPYEMVEVTLAVQVRTPPVDRAAAVQAGVL